ncbi:MAG: adenosine deaminase family protein [Candidatus Acidiferrales bacterium]
MTLVHGIRRSMWAGVFVLSAAACVSAQAAARKIAQQTPGEQRAERLLEAARANPLDLYAFLYRMPKGADLHVHLTGAVYAETFIKDGADDGLCIDILSHAFVKPRGSDTSFAATCGDGQVPASRALDDQHLYDALVDAFSMRSFVPVTGTTGHDHFFDSFDKFDILGPRHLGEWVNEVATRAAAQNEQYLELMHTPNFDRTIELAKQVGWNDDFAKLRDELLARGLRNDVAVARGEIDGAENGRRQIEHCGQPDAAPACRIEIRYLYQVLRGFPKEQVFAQALLGFETASADPRAVGINFVMPEDGYISMRDYALQMRMVGFLHALYSKVHISLHAGELAPGLVPYEGLCCHIRLAVEVAHAERIGHGVDVMHEDRPYDLLGEMAAKHVMVEINLTSNDVILGVTEKEHPLPIYRRYGVPVALSTDDEGVSRINLTHEYVRAVETYGFHYADLKQMVRTSMEHDFLPGDSLWRAPDAFGETVAVCASDPLGAEKPSVKCADFLSHSDKARAQWELERRFRAFELAP